MNIHQLTNIGLTEGEIKIYEALLELGETTRTELAKKSGVSPSKIYDVANRLLEKGIISAVKKNNVLHFSAANPEKLQDFLQQKEEEIQKEKQIVDSLLPSLLTKYSNTKQDTNIETFYGWEGMKTVYDDIAKALQKGDTNYIFGASQGRNPEQADLFFLRYYEKIKESGYKVKIIFNENVRKNKTRTAHFIKSKKHEVKFLYQDTFTEINLYKDTVLFIMLFSKPIVIRITNKEAASSFLKFFNTMWKQAKQ